MPKHVWTADLERKLMEEWHEIVESSQGRMMTRAEKIELAACRLRHYCEAEKIEFSVSTEQVTNKLDALVKKAKKAYAQLRVKTSTGSLVEDDYDLKAAYKDWSNFQTWHRLFFTHPNLGAAGFSKDTVTMKGTATKETTHVRESAQPSADIASGAGPSGRHLEQLTQALDDEDPDWLLDESQAKREKKPKGVTRTSRKLATQESLAKEMKELQSSQAAADADLQLKYMEFQAQREERRMEADRQREKYFLEYLEKRDRERERDDAEQRREIQRREYEEKRERERREHEERQARESRKRNDEWRRTHMEFQAELFRRLNSPPEK